MCKFDPDHVSEVRGKLLVAISLGGAWGTSRIRLPGQSVLALILSPRTVPNASTYRPDYLFQIVIGVWEVTPVDRVKLKTYRTDH